MKPEKIFNILREVAASSDAVGGSRVSAAIVQKREIQSIAWAKMKTHPIQRKYSKNEHCIYLHAEIGAILASVKKSLDLSRCSLYVCRTKRYRLDKGAGAATDVLGWGYCYPCLGCQQAISAFDIKQVFYTLDSIDLKFESMF